MNLSDKLAELAEIDLCRVESLVWDAWDILEKAGERVVTRQTFKYALKLAIDAHDQNPVNYLHNPAIGAYSAERGKE